MSSLYWEHSDSRGLAVALSEATTRAMRRDWQSDAAAYSGGTRAADLRALVLGSWWAAERMQRQGRTLPLAQLGNIDLGPAAYTDESRHAVAHALVRTWAILAPDVVRGPLAFRTRGGEPAANLAFDAGLPPVVAITMAVAVTAASLAAIFCGRDAFEVIDRHLERRAELDDRENERRQRLQLALAAQARATELTKEHVAQELAAGRELPISSALSEAIAELKGAQAAALQGPGPWERQPPMSHASDWIVPALLLGVGFFLVTR
jgi:hypothetical protein